MARDISPLELFSLSISFMYLKTMSVETFKFKVKMIFKFIFDYFDTWVIVKELNFFSTV